MNNELNQNLSKIIRVLEGRGMKSTKIAHAIGYTTTTQLYNSIEGKSLISTKAVMGLIKNLNVNPVFLFLGKGDMFLEDESEIETLRRENREWIQRHNEVVKAVMALYEINKKLEKRNADLIDLSSAAIKYHKGQNQEEQVTEENDQADVLSNIREIEKQYSEYRIKESHPNVKESETPLKQDEK
jgi:hypothetical protein